MSFHYFRCCLVLSHASLILAVKRLNPATATPYKFEHKERKDTRWRLFALRYISNCFS